MQNLFLSSVGYFQFFLRADDAVERPLFNVTHISWAILTDKYTIYCDSGTKLANSIHRVFNRNELVSIACDVHQYPVQDHPGHLRAVTIITFSHFYFPCIILIWLINWPFLLHTRKHICRVSFRKYVWLLLFYLFLLRILLYFFLFLLSICFCILAGNFKLRNQFTASPREGHTKPLVNARQTLLLPQFRRFSCSFYHLIFWSPPALRGRLASRVSPRTRRAAPTIKEHCYNLDKWRWINAMTTEVIKYMHMQCWKFITRS